MPAPEPTHDLAAAPREAEVAKQVGTELTVLTATCGRRHLALRAYEACRSGALTDVGLRDESIAEAAVGIPAVGCMTYSRPPIRVSRRPDAIAEENEID